MLNLKIWKCRLDRYRNKVYSKGKGKAMSLQARTGPEGSRRFSRPDFKKIST